MRSLPLVSLALVALIMLTAVSVNAQQDTTPPAERVDIGLFDFLAYDQTGLPDNLYTQYTEPVAAAWDYENRRHVLVGEEYIPTAGNLFDGSVAPSKRIALGSDDAYVYVFDENKSDIVFMKKCGGESREGFNDVTVGTGGDVIAVGYGAGTYSADAIITCDGEGWNWGNTFSNGNNNGNFGFAFRWNPDGSPVFRARIRVPDGSNYPVAYFSAVEVDNGANKLYFMTEMTPASGGSGANMVYEAMDAGNKVTSSADLGISTQHVGLLVVNALTGEFLKYTVIKDGVGGEYYWASYRRTLTMMDSGLLYASNHIENRDWERFVWIIDEDAGVQKEFDTFSYFESGEVLMRAAVDPKSGLSWLITDMGNMYHLSKDLSVTGATSLTDVTGDSRFGDIRFLDIKVDRGTLIISGYHFNSGKFKNAELKSHDGTYDVARPFVLQTDPQSGVVSQYALGTTSTYVGRRMAIVGQHADGRLAVFGDARGGIKMFNADGESGGSVEVGDIQFLWRAVLVSEPLTLPEYKMTVALDGDNFVAEQLSDTSLHFTSGNTANNIVLIFDYGKYIKRNPSVSLDVSGGSLVSSSESQVTFDHSYITVVVNSIGADQTMQITVPADAVLDGVNKGNPEYTVTLYFNLVNLGLTVTSSGVSGTYHTIKYSANSESTVVCSYYQKRKFFEELQYYQDVLGYSQFSTAILDAAADGKYIGGSRALATVKNALYRPSDGSITETVSLARGKFYAFLCVATTTVPNSSERDMVFGYVATPSVCIGGACQSCIGQYDDEGACAGGVTYNYFPWES